MYKVISVSGQIRGGVFKPGHDDGLALVPRVTPFDSCEFSENHWRKIEICLDLIRPFVSYCAKQNQLLNPLFVPIPNAGDALKFYHSLMMEGTFKDLINTFDTAKRGGVKLDGYLKTDFASESRKLPTADIRTKLIAVFGPCSDLPEGDTVSSYLRFQFEQKFKSYYDRLRDFFSDVITGSIKLPSHVAVFEEVLAEYDGERPVYHPNPVPEALYWQEAYASFLELRINMAQDALNNKVADFLPDICSQEYQDYLFSLTDTISIVAERVFSDGTLDCSEISKYCECHVESVIFVVENKNSQLNSQFMLSSLMKFLEILNLFLKKKLDNHDTLLQLVDKLTALSEDLIPTLYPSMQPFYKKELVLFKISARKHKIDISKPDYLHTLNGAIALYETYIPIYNFMFNPSQKVMVLLGACELYINRAYAMETVSFDKTLQSVAQPSRRSKSLKQKQLNDGISLDFPTHIGLQLDMLKQVFITLQAGGDFPFVLNDERIWAVGFVKMIDSVVMCIKHWTDNDAYIRKTPELAYSIKDFRDMLPDLLTLSVNSMGRLSITLVPDLYTNPRLNLFTKQCRMDVGYKGEPKTTCLLAFVTEIYCKELEGFMGKIQHALLPPDRPRVIISRAQIDAADCAMTKLIKLENAEKAKFKHSLKSNLFESDKSEVSPIVDDLSDEVAVEAAPTLSREVLKISTHKTYKKHYYDALSHVRLGNFEIAQVEFETVLKMMHEDEKAMDSQVYNYCVYQLPQMVYFASGQFFDLTPTSFSTLTYTMSVSKSTLDHFYASQDSLVATYSEKLLVLRDRLTESHMHLLELKKNNDNKIEAAITHRALIKEKMGNAWFLPKQEKSKAALSLDALLEIANGCGATQIKACEQAAKDLLLSKHVESGVS